MCIKSSQCFYDTLQTSGLGENGREDTVKNRLRLRGSIWAIGPSMGISCRPDRFCFWPAARCNHQAQRNLIIPGPDLSMSGWIANTASYCVKTLTPALIGHDLLDACPRRGEGFSLRGILLPSAAGGQSKQGTRRQRSESSSLWCIDHWRLHPIPLLWYTMCATRV